MNMLTRDWRLFRGGFALLRRNPRLLAFPALAAAAFLAELAAFGGGALLLLARRIGTDPEALGAWLDAHRHAWWHFLPALLPLYVLVNFTIIFFNAALVSCALSQLEGGQPTIRAGLGAAWSVRGRILGWALMSGIVSTLIEWLFSLVPGIGGKIAAAIGGLAWSLATFFVVPFLVFERVGVLDAISRSSSLFRRTWGDQAAVRVGFGTVIIALAAVVMVGVVVAIVIGHAVGAHHPRLTLAMILAAVLATAALVCVVGLLTSCLEQLFAVTLYTYARTGMLPEEIAPELLGCARPQ